MATDLEKEKKRLRQYLNPSIQGKNTDIILESIAHGTKHLIDTVESVNDMLYIVKAVDRFLDERMADRGIVRPENVGLVDEVFRELGIEISNRKQVRDLMMNILRIMYGEEFTRATAITDTFEPYQLADGDNLIIEYDDRESVNITFSASQFANIATATAQEVADAITKDIRVLGESGAATAKDDGVGGFVQLISETDGPSSSVRIVGGSAQNKLKFPAIRSTSGLSTTQWTVTLEPSGSTRATWTGGPTPSLGRVKKGDYVNIFGTAFSTSNRGTFIVTDVIGGLIGQSFVEFDNPNGVTETILQGTSEAILFFNPKRFTVISKTNFAAAYQTKNRVLEIFMPAVTKVVRRERKGAAHLHSGGAASLVDEDFGPYIYDLTKPFLIGGEEANTTQLIDASTSRVITVDDASQLPDQEGNLVFGFGTSLEEGPVPYIARPSNSTLIIDPSYKFKNVHLSGTNISLISQNFAFDVSRDGSDYPFYATDIVSGRLFAEETLKSVAATGITVIITILFPNDIGLGKFGTVNSEKEKIWGPDLV